MNDQVIIALAKKFANESKLSPSEVKQGIEDYLDENPEALDQAAVEAIAGQVLDNIVLIQSQQPTSDKNKLWILSDTVQETDVPTYQEFTDLNNEVDGLRSALNDKVDRLDIYGGETTLTPTSITDNKTVNYTNSGSAINIGNNNSREVVKYTVTDLRGKLIKVYNYNDLATRNYYTDAEDKVVGELTAGTSERTSTVPNTAVYLYLTQNKTQDSAYLKYTVVECLEKDIDDADDALQDQIDDIESVMVTHDEIYAHNDELAADSVIDGKYVGYTSSGAPVLNNNANQQVVVYDVGELAGEKLILCCYNSSSYNYWCDSDGNIMNTVPAGSGERTIYGLNGAKYLYISNLKTSGEAYLKTVVQDTIGANANQTALRMTNMLVNPMLTNTDNWTGITSVSNGVATVTSSSNPQIRQASNSIVFDEGDKLFCRVIADEITNVKSVYFAVDGLTNVDSEVFSFISITNGHDLLERKFPCSVGIIVEAPASETNGNSNRCIVNFVRNDTTVQGTVKLHGLALINLTKAFGAGNEPDASTIGMLLDGMDGGTFDESMSVTNAGYFLRGAEYMPKNGAGFSVNPLGYCEMRSVPNPDWPEWQYYWNTYGRSYNKCPIPNQVHGEIMTDAMVTVYPKFGRWSGWCNGNHTYGGHVFEAWMIDHWARLTMIVGKSHHDEANIIVYHVQDPDDPNDTPNSFGVVRIGADEDGAGFVNGQHLLEAYGNIAFAGTYGPVLKSPDGNRWRIRVDNNGDLYTEKVNITMRDES